MLSMSQNYHIIARYLYIFIAILSKCLVWRVPKLIILYICLVCYLSKSLSQYYTECVADLDHRFSTFNFNTDLGDPNISVEKHWYGRINQNIIFKSIWLFGFWNKRHFSTNNFFSCELKIFIFGQLCLLKPSWKIFYNVTTIFWRKKYTFIKMSFYLNIVCKILCVAWALASIHRIQGEALNS